MWKVAGIGVREWTTLQETVARKMRRLRRKVKARFSRLPEQKPSPSQVYSLFQEISDLNSEERARRLEALRDENEAAYREIKSLIEQDAPSPAPGLPPLLKPGDIVGRYTILEFLERGGMSEVYKASHPELGIRALKILSREVAENAGLMDRLRLEAKSASSLNHPKIVTVHDFDQQGHLHYMVMEFVEGQSLRKMIGSLAPTEAVSYARQMAEALNFAHARGIIHRDIKPENVMVRPDDNIKILDFGLAKPARLSAEAVAGGTSGFDVSAIKSDPHSLLMGTPPYMAPELLDHQEASAQSDIWSWGVVCYEMLAGRRPFEASSMDYEIGAIRNQEPGPPSRHRELNRIVMKALRKKPEERYRSMAEAYEDLTKFHPPNLKWRIATLALLMLIGIAAYQIYQASKDPALRHLGQDVPLTPNPQGHAKFPAVSPSLTRMIYTEEGRTESVLTLVNIVDGVSRDPRPIARSSDGRFMGAVFAPHDDQTVLVLLQHKENGSGMLFRLKFSSGGADGSGSSPGIPLNFAGDNNACQDRSSSVISIARYYSNPNGGRFLSICNHLPKEEMLASDSVDSLPSFSPDGKYFAFFSVDGATNRATLTVARTEGGEEVRVDEREGHLFLSPVVLWSPDGDEVLTATWESFDTTLWRIAIKNGKPVGRPKSYHLHNLLFRGKPAWVNGGRSIAVSASIDGASKSQIVQISLNGKRRDMSIYSIRDLDSITCPQGLGRSACRQDLIAAQEDDTSSVWVESLSDHKPVQLTNPGRFLGITWKDANTLISESENGKNPDLVLINSNRFNQTLEPHTHDEQWEKDPAVSPDGRFLIYDSNRAGGVHLWRKDLHDPSAEPVRLTAQQSVENQPSISPDGQVVIFTSITDGFQALWRISINGEGLSQIPVHPSRNASVSNNGDIVCEYLDGPQGNQHWVVAIIEHETNKLRLFNDIHLIHPNEVPVRWSHDGKSILYVKEYNGIENVWERHVKNGDEDTQFTHFREERIFAFALSPDGERVACVCGHEKYSQIVRMQLAK